MLVNVIHPRIVMTSEKFDLYKSAVGPGAQMIIWSPFAALGYMLFLLVAAPIQHLPMGASIVVVGIICGFLIELIVTSTKSSNRPPCLKAAHEQPEYN